MRYLSQSTSHQLLSLAQLGLTSPIGNCLLTSSIVNDENNLSGSLATVSTEVEFVLSIAIPISVDGGGSTTMFDSV